MLFLRLISLLLLVDYSFAATTPRVSQFTNDKVSVWKTIIYPAKSGALAMHRHDNYRVLVALTEGILKVTNDKGVSHQLVLKKDTAYYLKPDLPGEMHQDENLGSKPIQVMVIELKHTPSSR